MQQQNIFHNALYNVLDVLCPFISITFVLLHVLIIVRPQHRILFCILVLVKVTKNPSVAISKMFINIPSLRLVQFLRSVLQLLL